MNALLARPPHPACEATVIVPVRNEEERLPAALAALRNQRFAWERYEVILLLNNCHDHSVAIAQQFQLEHPGFALHLVERDLPSRYANVGTARRLLMDEAARRESGDGVILSTDGDSVVTPNWVSSNMEAIRAGADAVGGAITLCRPEYSRLPDQARQRFLADTKYHRLATLLESQLDPAPHDPWPRHHQHFGASLACRASVYRRAGGLPQVDCLEDVAFIESLGRLDARVRHSLDVQVSTTARSHGRVRTGLSTQLREWQSGSNWLVDSPAFLRHYFTCRAQLRKLWLRQTADVSALARRLRIAPALLAEQILAAPAFGALHASLDLRYRLWTAYPEHLRTVSVQTAVKGLRAAVRQSGSVARGHSRWSPIPGGFESSHAPDLRSLDSRLLWA